MQTTTTRPSRACKQPAAPSYPSTLLVSRYPTGFAWPAQDHRFGRYIMCPLKSDEPFGLGVVDDFGNLTPVPTDCIGMATAMPTTGLLA